jgi:hypothetical protein
MNRRIRISLVNIGAKFIPAAAGKYWTFVPAANRRAYQYNGQWGERAAAVRISNAMKVVRLFTHDDVGAVVQVVVCGVHLPSSMPCLTVYTMATASRRASRAHPRIARWTIVHCAAFARLVNLRPLTPIDAVVIQKAA